MTAVPTLDVLIAPDGLAERTLPPERHETRLARLYAHPDPARGRAAHVRGNMVMTLDGAAWGSDGLSGSINNAPDHRVFRLLRAAADVVLVGAGTVRAEGYGPPAPDPDLAAVRGAGRTPAPRAVPFPELAVVTASGDLPDALTRAPRPPFVVTTTAGAARLSGRLPADRALVTGETAVDLGRGLRELAGRGLTRVLCEGGPSLLGRLLSEGLVDELCLTLSPLLTGGAAGRPVAAATSPLDLSAGCAHLLHADGVLLGRWVIRDRGPAA